MATIQDMRDHQGLRDGGSCSLDGLVLTLVGYSKRNRYGYKQ